MKERRYKKAYQIVTDVDPKTGRVRETARYAGDWYAYPPSPPTHRRRGLTLGLGVGLYWASALAHLWLSRACSHCAYALLPFMLGLFPGAYAAMGAAACLRAPARMTVVQRENGPGRVTRGALGCGVLSAAGAAGCAVYLTLSRRWPEGWHEPLLAAAAALAGLWTFSRARRDYRSMTIVDNDKEE